VQSRHFGRIEKEAHAEETQLDQGLEKFLFEEDEIKSGGQGK